ncbi:MAG: hypothetical protein EON58_04065 [Alphaproteobacteria bacterium]|jgi:hypothetical protein|nr:MAG: hypothetical protein EON58_04065 [Alphaproteobacteria bacterium]
MSDVSEYRKHLHQIEDAIPHIEQQLCLLRARTQDHPANVLQSALTDERIALLSESYRLLQIRRLQILDKIESTAKPFSMY